MLIASIAQVRRRTAASSGTYSLSFSLSLSMYIFLYLPTQRTARYAEAKAQVRRDMHLICMLRKAQVPFRASYDHAP